MSLDRIRPADPSSDDLKNMAAGEAAGVVESGMRVGLGTGSTAAHFIEHLGARLACGDLSGVVGVPTSTSTWRAARAAGIALATLAELGGLDIAVDGADEVDPGLNLVKGLGGALLREKMVARAAARFVIIADESKLVRRLGERAPLPLEVVPFEFECHFGWLAERGAEPRLRAAPGGEPYRTDNGNLVIDCRFADGVADPAALDAELSHRAGVVESGLFLGMADEVVVAGAGGVRRLRGDGRGGRGGGPGRSAPGGPGRGGRGGAEVPH